MTRVGSVRYSNAVIAAISSIFWFVVREQPPPIKISSLPMQMTAAYPPGPESFPDDEPSVQMIICFTVQTLRDQIRRYQRRGWDSNPRSR